MKKEVLLAIIIGFSLGLIITFGIYTAKKSLNQYQANASPTPQPKSETSSPLPVSHSLTIIEPADESVFDQEKITLTGTTTPNSLVTIFTNQDSIIVYADTSGKFQTQITLVAGANEIKLSSISPDGEISAATLTLVYSTVKI